MQVIECEKIEAEVSEENRFNQRLCPFLQKPHDDCYIVNMGSLQVEAVIYYCSRNFEKCEIYKKQMKMQRDSR